MYASPVNKPQQTTTKLTNVQGKVMEFYFKIIWIIILIFVCLE